MRLRRADPTHQAGRLPAAPPLDLTALARMVLAVVAVLLVVGGADAAAASPIRQLTDSASESLRPAWSPDGTKIAFQRSDNGDAFQIYVMDANGRNVRRVSDGNVDDRHPSWSPDGKTIAVDSGTSTLREIWLIDVASAHRTQLTRIGANASFPSWSPDGTRLAFYEYRDGAADLWTIGRDGKDPLQITRDLATEQAQQCTFACHSAAWSPHGGRVAYTSGDQTRVLVMPASPGGAATAVSPKGENAHFPAYLADGRLVYVSEHVTLDTSWTDIWALPPGSDTARTEVAAKVQAQGPFEISPDGRQLLFASPRNGSFEIYGVTLDAAGKAALAALTAPASSVAAQPAPSPQARGWSLPAPFGPSTPYLLGLVAVGLVGLGVELLVRARRTRP